MNIEIDTTATLYREDPQYVDGYGTPGMQLRSTDAYVEVEAIPFDKIFEKTQFEVKCVERKKGNTPILPIQESLGLSFKFLEAYGFLYPVLDVEKENSEEGERIFKIKLEFDPDQIGSRVMEFFPLTAQVIENSRIELERAYDHDMKNPYCMRGKHTHGNRFLKLTRDSSNDRVFTIDSPPSELAVGERVQVLTNWDPSAV